jgi:hypothetical protein
MASELLPRRECERQQGICMVQRGTNAERITKLEEITEERRVQLLKFEFQLRDIKILLCICIAVSFPQLITTLPKIVALFH